MMCFSGGTKKAVRYGTLHSMGYLVDGIQVDKIKHIVYNIDYTANAMFTLPTPSHRVACYRGPFLALLASEGRGVRNWGICSSRASEWVLCH